MSPLAVPGLGPQELDEIRIEGVRAWGRHGVLAAERELGQAFTVDVSLGVSTAAAARTDDLARTVNYAEAAQWAREEIEGEPYALIETLADRIAARILAAGPLVRRVAVTVRKPAAPVGQPVDGIAVTARRRAAPVPAVLALGTNLGDRGAHLARALDLLEGADGIAIDWTGPVIETAPVGGPEQGPFLNTTIGVLTDRDPFGLLAAAHALERDARRERIQRWGPRTLDVDVIAYGEVRSDDPELTLPHPRAHERAFVLAPWHAARPEAVLPGHGPIAALLAAAPDRDGLAPGPSVRGCERP